jgi:hypothetical protein
MLQENRPEGMSVTEHVREAWRLLLNLPDGERERITAHLAERYAWSDVEAGTTALKHAALLERDDGSATSPDRATSQDELEEITANLTPNDVAKVRTLVEALRDGLVTTAELYGLPDGEWMGLIASRRAA